jgi:hypothetical protein
LADLIREIKSNKILDLYFYKMAEDRLSHFYYYYELIKKGHQEVFPNEENASKNTRKKVVPGVYS